MITQLNHLLDSVETDMSSELDISAVARELATTEYHLRRMFSSLTGMASLSPNRRPSPTILTRSTFLLERGLFARVWGETNHIVPRGAMPNSHDFPRLSV